MKCLRRALCSNPFHLGLFRFGSNRNALETASRRAEKRRRRMPREQLKFAPDLHGRSPPVCLHPDAMIRSSCQSRGLPRCRHAIGMHPRFYPAERFSKASDSSQSSIGRRLFLDPRSSMHGQISGPSPRLPFHSLISALIPITLSNLH